MTWFIIGLIVHPVNSRTSIILPIYCYTKRIMACQLTGISLQLHMGRERIAVLVEMSKMLFGERFCRIKLLLGILSLVSVAKEKFPNFAIESLNRVKYVMQQNTSLNAMRNILSTFPTHKKFHHIAIENKKDVGYFLKKTCPYHYQI